MANSISLNLSRHLFRYVCSFPFHHPAHEYSLQLRQIRSSAQGLEDTPPPNITEREVVCTPGPDWGESSSLRQPHRLVGKVGRIVEVLGGDRRAGLLFAGPSRRDQSPGVKVRVSWGNSSETICRYGYEGKFDIQLVEVDSQQEITKRYPIPDLRGLEGSFGVELRMGMVVRLAMISSDSIPQSLKKTLESFAAEASVDTQQITLVAGTIELPDYSAIVGVDGVYLHQVNKLRLTERELLSGCAELGWSTRFQDEAWVPGTRYEFSTKGSKDPVLTFNAGRVAWASTIQGEYLYDSNSSRDSACFANLEQMIISSDFASWSTAAQGSSGVGGGGGGGGVSALSRRSQEKDVQVRGYIKLQSEHLFVMDPWAAGPHLRVTNGNCTVKGTDTGRDIRSMALGTVGFSRGVHYWEIRVDQAEQGSVMLGVVEKQGPPGALGTLRAMSSSALDWKGWGFVNYRVAYHRGEHMVLGRQHTEVVYGEFFNPGDTVGVRLDMERGKAAVTIQMVRRSLVSRQEYCLSLLTADDSESMS